MDDMDESTGTNPPPEGPGPEQPGTGPSSGQPGAAHHPPTGHQPPPGHHQPRAGTDGFFDAVRGIGLVRSDDRWIGGVGGGLALRFGVDPLITRGLLAVSVLLGGLGLILYGLAWLLLPEQRDGRIHVQQLFRGDVDIAVLGGFAFFIAGVSFPDRFLPGFWWWGDRGWHFPWGPVLWIGVIVLVVALIAHRGQGSGGRGGGAPGSGPASAPPPPAATGGYSTGQAPAGPSTPAPSGPYWGSAAGTYPGPPHGGPDPAAWGSAPRPVTPTVDRPQGPGSATVGVVIALGLIVFAALSYARRMDWYDGPVLLAAGACLLILMGLGVIVAGLRGRTSGVLGGLATAGLIVLVPLSLVFGLPWGWHWDGNRLWDGNRTGTVIGDVTETPTTVSVAEQGFSLGAGEARIDLTELPLDGPPIEVPIRVGAGDLRIVLPEDGAYEASIRVFAGEVDWLGETVTRRAGGASSTFESEAVTDGAEADIVLDVRVGAGSVTITEAS